MSKYGVLSTVLSSAVSKALLSTDGSNPGAIEDLISELLGCYLENKHSLDDVEALLGKIDGTFKSNGKVDSREEPRREEKPADANSASDMIGFLRHCLHVAKGDKVCPMCKRPVNKAERGKVVSDLIAHLKCRESELTEATAVDGRPVFGMFVQFPEVFPSGTDTTFSVVVSPMEDLQPGEVTCSERSGNIFIGRDRKGYFIVSNKGRSESYESLAGIPEELVKEFRVETEMAVGKV